MAESKVKLPNGEQVTIRHKDGASEQDVLQFAFSEYVVNQDPGTVIGRSIAQGIDNLQQAYGSSLEGIGNILDAESLQQMGGDIVANNQAQIDARRFREQESLTDREGVAGAFDYVAELAGQSAPQMVTAFAGAGAGGAIGLLGGPLAPLTVPIGAFAGGFLANMPYFYGSNRERQKEAVEKGYKVEMDEGAAALAAIPQSALDAVFGAVGAKFLSTPLMKLQGGILTKATVGAGTGSIVEAPTEMGQTVLERYQAGLPLDDDEALKEIVAAGVGGAVLGGLFGGAGGAVAGIRTPKETKEVKEKEQGERQTFTVNYTNESTGQPTSTEVEADNEQQAQEIANKSLNKTAREGTIVVQKPVEPEPAPTPEPEPEAVVEEETAPEPAQLDYSNAQAGDVIQVVGVNGKRSQVEVIGVSKSGSIRFRRKDGTEDILGLVPDATLSDINSPNYSLQAAGHGTKGKNISDLTDAELDSLDSSIDEAMEREPALKQGVQVESLDHIADKNAIKIERRRRAGGTQTTPEPAPEPAVEPEAVVEEEVTPEPAPEPVVEVDNEAIKEQQDIIDDADYRVFDLQSEIEIEKSNIKEARANTKKDIANVRKSNLSKEDKAEKVEDLKAELQDTVDEINDNIDIYKEEMSEFRSELRKAKKKLTKLQPPEVTAGAAPVVRKRYIPGTREVNELGQVKLTQKEIEFFKEFLGNQANREELLEEVPSLQMDQVYFDGVLSIDSTDVDNLRNFVSDVGISDGLGTVPPRLKTAKFYRPFFVSEPEVTAEAAPVTTEDYNLLNSPFIKGYSGPGPQDASVPNYNSFHYVLNNPQRQALSSAIESGAVDALADNLVQETTEMMKDPSVSAGMGWYGRMRTRLNQIFGGDRDLFTHLLGTTSAQTAVEQNFRYSVDLYNRFKAGEFDSKIKKYLELKGRLQAGDLGKLLIRIKAKNSDGKVYTEQLIKKSKDSALLQAAARHYDLLPKQKNGKLYGANSYPALKALSQVWFDDRLGPNRMTPKTPQFAMNLNGQSLEATIDVWAARSLRRIIYKGQPEARIVPSEETAVSNPDFALGQLIFGRAAKKLNMNPDDLQAVIWFGEKKIWDQNGWTGAAGALKSSFDEPANVFYPIDGTTRSEADANLILDFLASERLVQRDIAFPEAVSLTTQANNRKKYDEYIRTSVISDFLESRGRREVYESESVESDRRRQVTRAINRLRGFSGKVRYRKGTGKEPKRSLGVIERGSVLSGKQFASLAKRNKSGNKFGSSVDVLTETEYESYDLIVIDSGPGVNVTLSISPDGEVGSVTKSPKATKLDVAAAFDMAISTGKVQFLNGFETVLPDIYASHGFVPVARLKFNPEFQPDGWSTQTYKKYNNGQPDIIFMRPGGQVGGTYNSKGFPEVSTYEEGVALSKDIIAEAAPTEPGGTFNQNTLYDFITDNFLPVSRKIGVDIVTKYDIAMARYNASQGVIEYNPTALAQQDQQYITAAMREEMIHAAMSKVILQKAKGKKEGEAFKSFMSSLGKSLTPEQRTAIAEVYSGLETDAQFGAEYSRAAIQQLLYGNVTESFITQGPAFTKLKNLFRSVQSYLARTFGVDVTTNPEAAGIIRASAELLQAADPNARPTNQKLVQEATAQSVPVFPNSKYGFAVQGVPFNERLVETSKFDEWALTMNALLADIDPALKQFSNEYYYNIESKTTERFRKCLPFVEKYRGIKKKSKKDFKRLKKLLLFSERSVSEQGEAFVKERDQLLKKYGMYNDFQLGARFILDQILDETQQAGIDMGRVYEYMPRSINDLDKVKEYYGKSAKLTFREYLKGQTNSDGEVIFVGQNQKILEARKQIEELEAQDQPVPKSVSEMANREIINVIGGKDKLSFEALYFDEYLQSQRVTRKPSALPGSARERTVGVFESELIPEEIIDAYDDIDVALERYIYNMTSSLETLRAIGRRFDYVDNGLQINKNAKPSDLVLLLRELVSANRITEEQAEGIIPDIFQRAMAIRKKEATGLELSRTLGYLSGLVEFTSTLSQLLDTTFVMVKNNPIGTLSSVLNTSVTGEMVGIDVEQIASEFVKDKTSGVDGSRFSSKLKPLTNFANKSLKKLLRTNAFIQTDRRMKNANLTANFNRYRKLANEYYRDKNSNKSKLFVSELNYLGLSPNQQQDFIAQLKKFKPGRPDSQQFRNAPIVRQVLFSRLNESQPMSKGSRALAASTNPNAQIFYMMKSFMVNQMNNARSEMITRMFDGRLSRLERRKALYDLLTLFIALMGVGVPVSAFKDFIAGRFGYFNDYILNSLLSPLGISTYTGYKIQREGPLPALYSYFAPVSIQMAGDMAFIFQKLATGRKVEPDDIIAFGPYSEIINRVFGFNVEPQKRKFKRKRKKGQDPLVVPPEIGTPFGFN